MATRYWVGGAGNWSSTTKWSTTSGGTSGASVPTSADDVIFDANSGGKFTATVDTAQTCASLSITPSSGAGVLQIAITSSLTVTGAFSTSGTAGNNRIWFRGTTYGVRTNLVCNGSVSISDCDFRDIIVNGTAAPISGTRIGNRGACAGITFSTPKTVYWNLGGIQQWSANAWASTSGGTPNTDNFPLPQDTAIFDNASAVGTASPDSGMYMCTVDMSARTNAMTFSFGANGTCYGSWKTGSGVTYSNASTLTFSGEGTKTITSAGKTFSCPITIDAYGGTVELADALNLGSQALTVTNGTFDTKNYNFTASGGLSSNNSNVRAINLGSSTLTIGIDGGNAIAMQTTTNLTFNAGTSQINIPTVSFIASGNTAGGGLTYYNVSFTSTNAGERIIGGQNTFNNLSLTASATGLSQLTLNSNQTINGTFTCAGTSATQRAFVRSNTLGTTRTITANAISANDCDFRDITIAGSAAGASPTRAGDCGGNSGINFPAPKTVYRVGTNNTWASASWALSSGGTGDLNNLPLAQDTAVIDNAASTATLSFGSTYNVGSIDCSSRTSALTLSHNASFNIYGNYTSGSGITVSGTLTQTFSGRGTQTFTSAGKTITFQLVVAKPSGAFELGDAINSTSSSGIILTNGTFDAKTYNLTCVLFDSANSNVRTLNMGSGLWTLTGAGSVWLLGTTSNLTFLKGTADILLSNNTTSARQFDGGGLSYNKLTIGGNTSTSTTTINQNNQFTELASTKTVAHTIALGTTTQTFGKWTVTGSAGNVVTLTGTGTSHVLAGSCTSGIDYLAMGSIGFAATSPAEFYAGANSTGTAGAPVYRTAKPADSTRYWVGGTGNWSDTARWSTSSGGASGASVPRSHDDVVFDTLSNLTAYTATVNAVTGGIRCKSLTIAPPATGNITLAGSTAINGVHGDVTLPATGLTRTYIGAITLSGSSTGRTFTTNGVTLANDITINGVGCGWTLGSALNISTNNNVTITNGTFDTNNFSVTANALLSSNSNTRIINLGSSSVVLSNGVNFTISRNLTFNAGTSQINVNNNGVTFTGASLTFYNVSFNATSAGLISLSGNNTFNNLTINASATGLSQLSMEADQTITGTFTCSGSSAIARGFVRSNTIGTTRTLTVGTLAANDCDFRDITIAGTAAGTAPTRAGDCGGNSGITFPAPKTVYWNLSGAASWGSNGWAATSGGTPAVNNFPLAQDTAVFNNAGAGTSIGGGGVNFNYPTIDMSARTNSFGFDIGLNQTIYGSFIVGSGITISGSASLTFSGRGTMTFTSAGKTITFPIVVDTPTGTFQLGDAFSSDNTITHTRGTFDAISYALTCASFSSSNSNIRTINMGSGLWSISGTFSVWSLSTTANLTFNKGTANILLTSTSASGRTFAGGNLSYNKLTIGGVTTVSLLNINDLSSFSEIASIKTVAHTIALSSNSIRVGAFTVTGTAGNVVTITGNTSNLIYTGSGAITGLDYLNVQGRVYGSAGQITDVWYAGANSVNSGSLGWVFAAGVTPPPSANSNFFLMFG